MQIYTFATKKTKNPSGGNLTGNLTLVASLRLGNLGCPEHPTPQCKTLYEDCTTFGNKSFTRFYSPVGKAHLWWFMSYVHTSRHAAQYKFRKHPNINSSRGWFHIVVTRGFTMRFRAVTCGFANFPCYSLASSFSSMERMKRFNKYTFFPKFDHTAYFSK